MRSYLSTRNFIYIISTIIVTGIILLSVDYFAGDKTTIEGIVLERHYESSRSTSGYDSRGNYVSTYDSEKFILIIDTKSDIETFNVDKRTYYSVEEKDIIRFITTEGSITSSYYGMELTW